MIEKITRVYQLDETIPLFPNPKFNRIGYAEAAGSVNTNYKNPTEPITDNDMVGIKDAFGLQIPDFPLLPWFVYASSEIKEGKDGVLEFDETSLLFAAQSDYAPFFEAGLARRELVDRRYINIYEDSARIMLSRLQMRVFLEPDIESSGERYSMLDMERLDKFKPLFGEFTKDKDNIGQVEKEYLIVPRDLDYLARMRAVFSLI